MALFQKGYAPDISLTGDDTNEVLIKYNDENAKQYTEIASVATWFEGNVAPFNPVVGMKWKDITTSPAILKRWNGLVWENENFYIATLDNKVSKGELVVNVKDYGAIGDGVTDDTIAVQNALNSGGNIYIPNGYIFAVNNLVYTSKVKTLMFGGGTLRYNVPGIGTVLKITGSDGLTISNIIFDGNKSIRIGGEGSTRSYWSTLWIDADTSNTTIENCELINAYYGANIINIGTYTNVISNLFKNSGPVSKDGTCDGIYNGRYSAEMTGSDGSSYSKITGNNFIGMSDYAVACDANDIIVNDNFIEGCNAGIGAFARPMAGVNIKVYNNTIKDCTHPIDFYNSTGGTATGFVDCVVDNNTLYGTNFTVLSVSGSNGAKVCTSFKIRNNIVYMTYGAGYAGIAVSASTPASSENVEISGNLIYGTNAQDLSKGISVDYSKNLNISNNKLMSCDFGITIINSDGHVTGNSYSVVRDALTLVTSNVYIDEAFENVPRRAFTMQDGCSITGRGVSFYNCNFPAHPQTGAGLFLYGTPSILDILSLSLIGINNLVFNNYASGNNKIKVVNYDWGDQGLSSITPQASWNINTVAPTAGTWVTGDKAYNVAPTAGGYSGWICIAGGTPGTWKGYGLIQT